MEKKIEQIDIGDTEWELNEMLRKYRPEVIAKILDKIVEIVDYLNTQPKEEKLLEDIDRHYKDWQEHKKDFDKEASKQLERFEYKKQDTPGEWEEELGKLMSTWGKVLFVNKGRIGAGMQTAMYLKFYHFIKNLLSEREVFTKDDLFMLKLATNDIHNKGNGAYDEIGEKIGRMLSKLNKKK